LLLAHDRDGSSGSDRDVNGRRSEPTVAIDGVGVVGGRLARELVSADRTLGVELHARSDHRRATLVEAFGSDVSVCDPGRAVSDSVAVVVLSGPQDEQAGTAADHVAAGRHVVAVTDRPPVVRALLDLDASAMDAGVAVVVGAGFSPGLSGVMAARLAQDLDSVEIHYARHGAAGRLCASDRLSALRHQAPVWRDGRWIEHRPGSGRELCWFPDPIGGADAYRAATGEPLLAVDAFASLRRSSARLVMSRWDRVAQYLPVLLPAPAEGGMGALRVEVRGARNGRRVTEVAGTLDRPGVAAAALAAEVVASLLSGSAPSGAYGMEKWPDPGGLLAALRERGIRTATPD
jgi:hypothetical protein